MKKGLANLGERERERYMKGEEREILGKAEVRHLT